MFFKLAIAITLVLICDSISAKRQDTLFSAPSSPEIQRTVKALAERDSTESEAESSKQPRHWKRR